jgi:hypothetical protein
VEARFSSEPCSDLLGPHIWALPALYPHLPYCRNDSVLHKIVDPLPYNEFVKWIVCIEISLQMSLGDLLVQDVGEILVRLGAIELGAHVNDDEESNRFFLCPAFRGHVKYSKLCLKKMSKKSRSKYCKWQQREPPLPPPHKIYTPPFPLASCIIPTIHAPLTHSSIIP